MIGRNTNYDVVIVGAGPSGSVLSYELAKRGVSTLLLEKVKLPRYKACAGGVNVRAASLLPFSIDDCVERVIYGARLSYRLGERVTRVSDQPLTYMVSREKFDHFLARQAESAGAVVRDGVRVERLAIKADGVVLETSSGTLAAQVVVGADGARSVVAKELGFTSSDAQDIGLDCRVTVQQNRLAEWEGLVGLDYGTIQRGYGWVFPKLDHLSLGVKSPLSTAKGLRSYLHRFIESLGFGRYEVQFTKGHFMPMRLKKFPIVRERALLIGDAAGLIDPFTGEGMFYAMKSAQLAAPAIEKALVDRHFDLMDYEKAVDRQIAPELQAANGLLKGTVRAPRLTFELLANNARVWRAFCRLLRGESTYTGIWQELGLFWRIANAL